MYLRVWKDTQLGWLDHGKMAGLKPSTYMGRNTVSLQDYA